MRKTVDEWLMSHQKGAGMPKKRRGQAPAKLVPSQAKQVAPRKKKSAHTKAKRRPK